MFHFVYNNNVTPTLFSDDDLGKKNSTYIWISTMECMCVCVRMDIYIYIYIYIYDHSNILTFSADSLMHLA